MEVVQWVAVIAQLPDMIQLLPVVETDRIPIHGQLLPKLEVGHPLPQELLHRNVPSKELPQFQAKTQYPCSVW